MTVRSSSSGQRLPVFIRALAAAQRGAPADETAPEASQTNPSGNNTPGSISELEVAAIIAAAKNNYEDAIAIMKRAVGYEEQLAPPSGPPAMIKPTHELLGEILLRAGKPGEAAEQFKIALLRQPNRARSLLGAARAAKQKGDLQAARNFYAKLSEQWQQADKDLAELREAQDYLKQAKF
jgi:tetratricopeptide (TPR) repeat protein